MKSKLTKILPWVPFCVVIILGIFLRIQYFNQTGKDISAFQTAVNDFTSGVNPYLWTVESFSNDDFGDNGYAFLPGFLYLHTFLSFVSQWTGIPFHILVKIPVLLSDLGIVYLLIKVLKEKSYWFSLVSVVTWLFNPYIMAKSNYVYMDSLPIFLMFWSLYLVEKYSLKTGLVYAFSIATKTFPYLIFPIMFLRVKNKFRFITAGLFIAVLISTPFLTTVSDFITYLEGAVLVHSSRMVQGRPLLFYISYFYDVELFQIIPLQVYTWLASLGGWLVLIPVTLKFKCLSRYTLSMIPFAVFYLFTPVFNRTYLLWFLPVFLVGVFDLFRKTNKFLPYVVVGAFYVFYYWYLVQWIDGFHIWHP